MTSFAAVSHRIPKCFTDKIALDREWERTKSEKVVDLMAFRRLRGLRLVARDRCEQHVRQQRGPAGGLA